MKATRSKLMILCWDHVTNEDICRISQQTDLLRIVIVPNFDGFDTYGVFKVAMQPSQTSQTPPPNVSDHEVVNHTARGVFIGSSGHVLKNRGNTLGHSPGRIIILRRKLTCDRISKMYQ